jgi:alanine racemase
MSKDQDMLTSTGNCWVEVDLAAMRRNFRLAAGLVPPGTPIVTVVKANAYGHGMVPVAKTLLDEGASILGVATVTEGRELREAGIGGRVLVMGRTVDDELSTALRWHLEITIPHPELAKRLSAIASRQGRTVKIHLKVDTGMTRLGVPWQEAHKIAAEVRKLPGLELAGVYTHFANADLADQELTREQIERFDQVRQKLSESGIDDGIFHLANSAAILVSKLSDDSGVRPGLMLYGSSPSEHTCHKDLVPVLTWKCRVIQVREVPKGTGISYGHDFITARPSRIATISTGYADGYMRSLTNRSDVLIGGQRAPVVGRVTMDMIMVDITGKEGISAGDEVVLIGKQGKERITAEELAELAGTINYEIYCGISSRVPRLYFDEG